MTIMTSSAAVRSSALTGAKPGCARYMAPELLKFSVLGSGEECRPSKESDVYSLGMAAFQVHSSFIMIRFTGQYLIPWLGSLGGLAVRWHTEGTSYSPRDYTRPATPSPANRSSMAT